MQYRFAGGTTEQKAAPSILALERNFFISEAAERSNQAAVFILTWRRTRSRLASPRWVWVFPMSRRRIISGAEGDIAADDAFKAAVLGADEERAFRIERFGVSFNFAGTGGDFDMVTDSGAVLLPFIRDGFEFSAKEAMVVDIQLTKQLGGKFGAVNGMAKLNLERGGYTAQIYREIGFIEIDVHADAENDVFDFIQLGGHFGENAADFFAANKDI